MPALISERSIEGCLKTPISSRLETDTKINLVESVGDARLLLLLTHLGNIFVGEL